MRRFVQSFVMGIIAISFVSSCFGSEIQNVGSEFPFGDGSPGVGEESIDLGKIVKEEAVDPKDSASELIQKELGVAYQDAEDQRATYYIKQLINWFLAIIGLVAVGVLLYGFYKMFFSSNSDESFADALKIVKGAAIALIVIGLSRFIVSILFDVFFSAKEDI